MVGCQTLTEQWRHIARWVEARPLNRNLFNLELRIAGEDGFTLTRAGAKFELKADGDVMVSGDWDACVEAAAKAAEAVQAARQEPL